jgi:hypothetical protein
MTKTLNYAANASKLQIAFGSFLLENYGSYDIQQEKYVITLCPDHPYPLDRFDYYIAELNIAIELHGKQHYKPATFGGVSKREALSNYGMRVIKDSIKAESAFRNGIIYISFAYNEEITVDTFTHRVTESSEFLKTLPTEPQVSDRVNSASALAYEETKQRVQKASKDYWKERRAQKT